MVTINGIDNRRQTYIEMSLVNSYRPKATAVGAVGAGAGVGADIAGASDGVESGLPAGE